MTRNNDMKINLAGMSIDDINVEESITEAGGKNNIVIGDEISYDQAKTFYNRGYIDLVIYNNNGKSITIKGWHSQESQKEISKVVKNNKETVKGNAMDLRSFDDIVNDAKKELGNDIHFKTASPESNKGYVNTKMDASEMEGKHTGIAYKLFLLKNGKLYPPMIKNPGLVNTPIGQWVKCGALEFTEVSASWGKPKAKDSDLAFRPGWHLGEAPYAPQFESRKNPGYMSSDKFVWGECEYNAEVDYQERARSYGFTKDGNYSHSAMGLPYRPDNGYYKMRTNPNPDTIAWVITGEMKVNRILGDDEVERLCNKMGVPFLRRPGGDKTLSELGLRESYKKFGYVKQNINEEKEPLKETTSYKLPRMIRTDLKEDFGDSSSKEPWEVPWYRTYNSKYGVFSTNGTYGKGEGFTWATCNKNYLDEFSIKDKVAKLRLKPCKLLFYNHSDEEWDELVDKYGDIGDNDVFDTINPTEYEASIMEQEGYDGFFDGEVLYVNKDFLEVIDDDINLETESLEESVEKHDTLNPKLFNEDNTIKEEVRNKLLEIANFFMDKAKEDGVEFDVKDILIVGSNANYNYTNESDIDLHIVVSKTPQCNKPEHLGIIYQAYKSMFNNKYDCTINGVPVEVYVEFEDEDVIEDPTEEASIEEDYKVDITYKDKEGKKSTKKNVDYQALERTMKAMRDDGCEIISTSPSDIDEGMNSISPTTPYMLRNDGKLLECGIAHPYVKISLEQGFEASYKEFKNHPQWIEWLVENSNQEEVKSLCKKEELTEEEFNKLNDLVNQEFCRVRTSNFKYQYGGNNGEIYFRISSKNFNWFDLIWQVVMNHKNSIKNVTVMKDSQSLGGKGFDYYVVDGKKLSHIDVEEFLTLKGNPVLEGE